MVYANDILAGRGNRGNRGNGIANLFANLKDTFAKRRAYVQTRKQLALLNDRELNDLGLHKSQIDSVAFQSVYGARA